METKMNKEQYEAEQEELLSDEIEEEVVVTEGLDWKTAAKKLKSNIEKYKDDYSIDTYFVKQHISALRERYNSKERTEELYAELMSLEEV